MAAGLRVWDEQGRPIVDTSTLIPRIFTVGEVSNDGEVIVPQIAAGTNVGVTQVIVDSNSDNPPEATLQGSRLYWKFNGSPGIVNVVLL